jgi:hypothetical protein
MGLAKVLKEQQQQAKQTENGFVLLKSILTWRGLNQAEHSFEHSFTIS